MYAYVCRKVREDTLLVMTGIGAVEKLFKGSLLPTACHKSCASGRTSCERRATVGKR